MSDSPGKNLAGSLPAHHLSVVVPMYNEARNVEPMAERLHEALAEYPQPWELVVVDDGSVDGTAERLQELVGRYGDHVRLVTLQRNFGQTSAMQAGIDAARGDVICTLDGDLQNDPLDIPPMVHRLLSEDLDLLVGWRKARKDALVRRIVSRLANRLIGWITGVRLNDYGCSLKIYRAEVIHKVRLYGEMHRFIPAWVAMATKPGRIRQHVVHHHARQHGVSKYGLSRTFRVVLDLIAVYFFMRFRARPGHFFGTIGLVFGMLGGVILVYLTVYKLLTGADIGDRPLLLLGILLVVGSIQFLTTGILGEMMARTYFESSQVRPYVVWEAGSRGLEGAGGWHGPSAAPVSSRPRRKAPHDSAGPG